MRMGLTISTAVHGAFLVWSIITLVAKPFDSKVEMSPVDIVSADEFSKITKGHKDAKKPEPKLLVEKIAEPKPVEDLTKKVNDKKEVTPTEKESAPQADSKPEPKPEKAVDKKADPIADALKKDEAKKPEKEKEKKAEAKTPVPNNTKQQPKFDVTRIAALLNKKDPQRNAATGAELSPTAGLGAPNGKAQQLSQSELDALRARLSQCWSPPVGALEAQRLIVVLRIMFNPDGTVSRTPELMEATPSPVGPAMVESAKRAVLQCQPYTMLRRENYDTWKDMELMFDPRDMFRG